MLAVSVGSQNCWLREPDTCRNYSKAHAEIIENKNVLHFGSC